jgi:hypothetical protein
MTKTTHELLPVARKFAGEHPAKISHFAMGPWYPELQSQRNAISQTVVKKI